jgi:thiamine biosynthesis lipoprotein
MVNIGGDLRVSGLPPGGADGWTIAIEDPFHPEAEIWRPTLADGGVASSSTRIRTWDRDGRTRHHLVDPSTGDAPETDVVAATVVAGTAWLAEVFTKVAMTLPAREAVDVLDDAGLAAVVVDTDGRLTVGSRIGAFA